MSQAGRKAVAAALALTVAAAAGCGGSSRLSKSAYEKKLKAEATQLRADFSGVNLQTNDLQALAGRVGRLGDKLQRSAEGIDKLKPPKDAEADNTKIASALHQFADLFKKIQQAARSGDKAGVQKLVGQIQAAGATGNAATQDLKQKGYDIGAFGG